MIEIIEGLPNNVVGIAVEGAGDRAGLPRRPDARNGGNHLRRHDKTSGSTTSSIRDFRVPRGTISTSGSSTLRGASGSQL